MQVAALESHLWSVTARGFSGELPNKMLVLVDGRSVYSPIFAGVWWAHTNPLLEDVERVEVIRGPGATLWGANAVNGVINIITKRAADTPGWLATVGGGTEHHGLVGARYGGRLGEDASFRVSGRYWRNDGSAVAGLDRPAADRSAGAQGGFRVDWNRTAADLITVQGDGFVYWGDDLFTSPLLVSPYAETKHLDRHVVGGNVLARWTHWNADGSEFKLQGYYDLVHETGMLDHPARDVLHTFDLEFEHRFRWGSRQEIVWGAGYRLMDTDLRLLNSDQPSFAQWVVPRHRTLHLYTAFVQDEIEVVPERLALILGAKLEHHELAGWELQPSGRLLWTPDPRHTVWGAVSRAARAPGLVDSDFRINVAVMPGAPDPLVVAAGRFGAERRSEGLIAYELGYRVQPTDRCSLDVAAFYNVYDHLVSLEPGAPFAEALPAPAHVVLPLVMEHRLAATAYGVELAGAWAVTDHWRLRAAYSFLELNVDASGSADPISPAALEGRSPRHQWSVQSAWDIGRHWELDGTLRYVDRLPDLAVPAYLALDVRLAWKPNARWEAALVGQNLLHDQHVEMRPSFLPIQQTAVQWGVYGKVTWRY